LAINGVAPKKIPHRLLYYSPLTFHSNLEREEGSREAMGGATTKGTNFFKKENEIIPE
jgi:hypothetical protein